MESVYFLILFLAQKMFCVKHPCPRIIIIVIIFFKRTKQGGIAFPNLYRAHEHVVCVPLSKLLM